jgi:RHS repeat-associated protein
VNGDRLSKYGTTEYKYDSANNPTKEGSITNTYNEGDELEKGTGTTYAYDELGERTKTTPEKGGATTYGYDQTENLTSVERPEKESVPKIEDSYTYDGNSLRASQTISGTTTYFAWDMTEELPQILSDGTNSYIYGSGGLPVEQIGGAETPSYLHHDQQGSIRLLTGSAGTSTGSITFDAYGNKVESTGTISPLGYDGQYTSSDTGLIYLRARVYDPATAQFLTVDPIAPITGSPYNYAYDNPVNAVDPTGLCSINPFSSGSCLSEAAKAVKNGAETVVGGAEEGAKATAGFVYEHPVILPAIGCTVGMLASPAVCVAAVGTSLGLSTAKNAIAYSNGELTGEQVFYEQLLDVALSGAGAVPGLPLLGTGAGSLLEEAPAVVQVLVGGLLEFPDIVFGSLEPNISCALLGVT